jgi:hypothetical protein
MRDIFTGTFLIPWSHLILGCFHSVYLLCNNGEHLNVNAVELIKAAPATRLSQTRKELSKHLEKVDIRLNILVDVLDQPYNPGLLSS